MADIWVVNSSPLITLTKAGHVSLLAKMSAEVLIPEPVALEVLAGPDSDLTKQEILKSIYRRVPVPAIPQAVRDLALDPGESSVLALAMEHGNCITILDDGKARRGAKKLGIRMMGTLGVILGAKVSGEIASANAVLHQLRDAGLYLDDALLRQVLSGIGEVWP